MWWQDLLWGLFNGFTAWVVWFAHLFGWWDSQPVYDPARAGGWYDLGFLFGAGSPFLGFLNGSKRKNTARPAKTEDDIQPVYRRESNDG